MMNITILVITYMRVGVESIDIVYGGRLSTTRVEEIEPENRNEKCKSSKKHI